VKALGALAVAGLVVLNASACTDSEPDAEPTSSAPASESGPPAPDLAGAEEAEALAALPTGPASGTAVLAYSGLGELREPFTGECTRNGDTTRIEGTADTAEISLVVSPDGARLDLDDQGVTASSALGTGRYEVSGTHLSLAAGLSQDGQDAGTAELEIDCGG
jgi:hypothetical protein